VCGEHSLYLRSVVGTAGAATWSPPLRKHKPSIAVWARLSQRAVATAVIFAGDGDHRSADPLCLRVLHARCTAVAGAHFVKTPVGSDLSWRGSSQDSLVVWDDKNPQYRHGDKRVQITGAKRRPCEVTPFGTTRPVRRRQFRASRFRYRGAPTDFSRYWSRSVRQHVPGSDGDGGSIASENGLDREAGQHLARLGLDNRYPRS